MPISTLPIATGAATLFVLASAASLTVDPNRPATDRSATRGVERTVAIADLCANDGCSIAYKTEDGGPPSRVIRSR